MAGMTIDELLEEVPKGKEDDERNLYSGVRIFAEMKDNLKHERANRLKAEKQISEMERANEHLMAGIKLHRRFEDIVRNEAFTKGEKLQKLEKLAILTAGEGRNNFEEIQSVLRIKRSILRNWLRAKERAYGCGFADGGKIMASTPGEAALCLRCFECEPFELGECAGYGNEKRPENIIDMFAKLKANGIYNGAEQSRILTKYYNIPLSPRDIASIRYRAKKGLPIPDEVFYMDMRKTR
jgi:hypothetical protein